jgi:hypothetical protein
MKKTVTSTSDDGRTTTHTVTGIEVTPAEMKPHIEAAFKAGWEVGFDAAFKALAQPLSALHPPIVLSRSRRRGSC